MIIFFLKYKRVGRIKVLMLNSMLPMGFNIKCLISQLRKFCGSYDIANVGRCFDSHCYVLVR